MSDEADRVVDELLQKKLPRYAAPPALVEGLRARLGEQPARRPRRAMWVPLAVAAALAIAGGIVFERVSSRKQADAEARLVGETVNDHLRVLYSEHPLDVASSESHQVKPWFQGKLDFAPPLAFTGDADFVLDGGSVGYFIDRKAAVVVFHRRQHRISLLIFRADGLQWPSRGLQPLGRTRALATQERGFSVVLWRDGGLGYALASDLNLPELLELGERIAR